MINQLAALISDEEGIPAPVLENAGITVQEVDLGTVEGGNDPALGLGRMNRGNGRRNVNENGKGRDKERDGKRDCLPFGIAMSAVSFFLYGINLLPASFLILPLLSIPI